MLFRPEEIVLASSVALEDYALFREYAQQSALIRFNPYPVNAMCAGVVKRDPVHPVLAADQQQEINCSRETEVLLTVQCHRMIKET